MTYCISLNKRAGCGGRKWTLALVWFQWTSQFGLLHTSTLSAENMIRIGWEVSETLPVKVKSWGHVYLSRRINSAKYSRLLLEPVLLTTSTKSIPTVQTTLLTLERSLYKVWPQHWTLYLKTDDQSKPGPEFFFHLPTTILVTRMSSCNQGVTSLQMRDVSWTVEKKASQGAHHRNLRLWTFLAIPKPIHYQCFNPSIYMYSLTGFRRVD